jgi:large subunit ribosomal protein L9
MRIFAAEARKRRDSMKVILADDVRGLGHRGDTVAVKPGYARNFLFPQGFAFEATAANIRKLGEDNKKYDEKMLHEKAGAENVAKQIEGLTVVITKKSGEGDVLYGSVTPTEIADALAEKGIEVDRRRIELAEPIKRLGEHRVHVRLHRDVTTELIVAVQPLAPVTA